MGLLSGLWNAATWVWNQLQNVAPGFTNAVTNTVTNIVDTVVNAVQNTGSQSNTPAQPSTPTTPTGPSPEEIRQQRINQRGNQFDRDIGRLMRPELEEDARFYDEYPSDRILNSPASMADMILLAGQNPVVYGLMQMMRNERQTLNIVMQNAKSTVDGLRLLFADAIHNEEAAAEAAAWWDRCVGSSSTSWQPGMSSAGYNFVVSNNSMAFLSQEGRNGDDESRIYRVSTSLGELEIIQYGRFGMLDLSSFENLGRLGLSNESFPLQLPLGLDSSLEREGWMTVGQPINLSADFTGDIAQAYTLMLNRTVPTSPADHMYDRWISPAIFQGINEDTGQRVFGFPAWNNLDAELYRRSMPLRVDDPRSLYPPLPAGARPTTKSGELFPYQQVFGEQSAFPVGAVGAVVVVSAFVQPIAEVGNVNAGNEGFVTLGEAWSPNATEWKERDGILRSLERYFLSPITDNETYDTMLTLEIQSRSPRGEWPYEGIVVDDENGEAIEYRVVINTTQLATLANYSEAYLMDFWINSNLAVGQYGFDFPSSSATSTSVDH